VFYAYVFFTSKAFYATFSFLVGYLRPSNGAHRTFADMGVRYVQSMMHKYIMVKIGDKKRKLGKRHIN